MLLVCLVAPHIKSGIGLMIIVTVSFGLHQVFNWQFWAHRGPIARGKPSVRQEW
jgi:hypothetical protein